MVEIKDSVSLTSRIMAALRAIETQRPDRLFEDPLAAVLAGDDMIAEVIRTAKEYENRGTPFVATRTRFFDDFLMSVAHQTSQVVILGAGMDTRAFRLSWHPDTHLYEVDRPEVLQFKESLLENSQALCHRHSLSIDLKQPWSELLIAQGFQIDIPSAWLVEGVFYYLSDNEVHDLLKTITHLSAPTSYLGADLINTKSILQSNDGLSKHWRYGCEEPETLFATYGWKASVVQPGDEQAHFGRYTYKFPPRDVPDVARVFFATALKE
ncbi:SAM-dependent methyltransferase [Scytonema sp. NUACC26]|uniref:SAM-dependent methyltransferase n=1 Tax=Scytonema sp. NUACC26 TaxID=3140176 RepID=UPI0034DC0987